MFEVLIFIRLKADREILMGEYQAFRGHLIVGATYISEICRHNVNKPVVSVIVY